MSASELLFPLEMQCIKVKQNQSSQGMSSMTETRLKFRWKPFNQTRIPTPWQSSRLARLHSDDVGLSVGWGCWELWSCAIGPRWGRRGFRRLLCTFASSRLPQGALLANEMQWSSASLCCPWCCFHSSTQRPGTRQLRCYQSSNFHSILMGINEFI